LTTFAHRDSFAVVLKKRGGRLAGKIQDTSFAVLLQVSAHEQGGAYR